MRLAKDCLDVALFTGRRDVATFWRDDVGLVLDQVLPVRRGHVQYRFDLNGSVLKVNVVDAGVPATGRSTIVAVVVADPDRAGTSRTDADGTTIRFVEPGEVGLGDVEQVGIGLVVSDLERTMRFYAETLRWEQRGDAQVRCGRTTLSFDEQHDVVPAPNLPVRGWAYVTVQIHDCDAEHAAVLGRGALEGVPPVTMGDVARFSMVRDPDGNWIELSQRASLTGPLPAAGHTPR
jgi:predicted enzyme related to lactoylglutathione lyase